MHAYSMLYRWNESMMLTLRVDPETWRFLRAEAERWALRDGGRASVAAVLRELVARAREEAEDHREAA